MPFFLQIDDYTLKKAYTDSTGESGDSITVAGEEKQVTAQVSEQPPPEVVEKKI